MTAIVKHYGLTFADVLIAPQYSEIDSRIDIDVLSYYLGGRRVPIISAPMDYVTGELMAVAMFDANAYGIVSRFGETNDFPDWTEYYYEAGLAIGIRNLDKTIEWLHNNVSHSICIDVAHGHHSKVLKAIRRLQEEFPRRYIIAGNVATAEGFRTLSSAGVDAIRVGIGPGSACSTREHTGIGVPQLTAIINTAKVKYEEYPDVTLIADGGIQTPGDIVKALAAGADAVMLGRMLAGHKESPGPVMNNMKAFRGQSSVGANAERGVPEGIAGYVPTRGSVGATIEVLMNYLRSGMSYVGAKNLQELREKAEFIEVSQGTFRESETRI